MLRFEKCVAVSENQGPKDVPENSFLHYVADNVDHDSCTIDGRGTFHGMGIISAITPVPGKVLRSIPRKEVSAEDIKALSSLSFHFYNRARETGPNVLYKPLLSRLDEPRDSNTDLLWYSSWFFKQSCPNWSGFMQSVHKGSHPGKTAVFFHLMIDYNPSD